VKRERKEVKKEIKKEVENVKEEEKKKEEKKEEEKKKVNEVSSGTMCMDYETRVLMPVSNKLIIFGEQVEVVEYEKVAKEFVNSKKIYDELKYYIAFNHH